MLSVGRIGSPPDGASAQHATAKGVWKPAFGEQAALKEVMIGKTARILLQLKIGICTDENTKCKAMEYIC
jgi:hypothetical protein